MTSKTNLNREFRIWNSANPESYSLTSKKMSKLIDIIRFKRAITDRSSPSPPNLNRVNRKPATAHVTDRNEISGPDRLLFKYGRPPSVKSKRYEV